MEWRAAKKLPPFVLIYLFLFSSVSYSAPANFYTLNEKWEKTNLSGKTKEEAVDESLTAALLRQSPHFISAPTPPVLNKSLTEIGQGTNVVEIEQNQSLLVRASTPVVKFVATEEGIASLETVSADTIRILGTGIGSTFVHIWDSTSRSTFELRVLQPKFIPSRYQIRQQEAYEKSRSFKIGYDNSRSAFYTGDKYREINRGSLDFVQNLRLEGDTPYGAFSSHAQTQKARGKTLLTDTQVALKDGKIGHYKNFNVLLGDVAPSPGLIVFPGARVRGAEVDHWDDQKRVQWTGFHGRQQSSILGTLTPGIVSKRTLNSYLAGGVVDYKMNDQARFKTGYFTGWGRSRPDELNRRGVGEKAEITLGPHVTFSPEIDFDNEHFAQNHSLTARFDKLRVRNEWRDISKKFFTMIGAPSRQGEIGNLLEVTSDPFENVSLSGTLDVFRDRLISNPEDPDALNIHTDLSLTTIPWENSSLGFSLQDLDDTGRLGPNRQRAIGMQFSQRFNLWGHRATVFSRYQNRGSRILNNSLSNYVQNQVIFGLQTEIFWGINFSIQDEWSGVKEPNINRFTRPHALTYNFDYTHQIGDTPFFMETRLRIRDEEDTESSNSFMAGEDSTEISGGIYYREYEDLEIFLTGSFSNFRPESLNAADPRVEAQFLTGLKYLFDTGYRWSAVGSFEGYVFKDVNGDGVRQPDEPGIPGMVIAANDGKEAATNEEGFYQLKSITGRKAVLTLDNSKIPYGYTPTSAVRQEKDILQGKTQEVNFSLTPRSEISGIIYNDLNGNGKYELTDVGVRKVKIILEDGAVAKSNNLGVYSFPNVVAGEHTVSLVLTTLPEGYLPWDVPKKTFAVFEGIRFELNFPLRAVRNVTGRVYRDENHNGNMEADEKTLSDVRILLDKKAAVSDKEGWYLFDNLNQGTYEISLDNTSLPPGVTAAFLRRSLEMPTEPKTVADMNLPVTDRRDYSEETV